MAPFALQSGSVVIASSSDFSKSILYNVHYLLWVLEEGKMKHTDSAVTAEEGVGDGEEMHVWDLKTNSQ